MASNQYGGQSISLAHLAPFVQVSRDKIRAEVLQEMEMVGIDYPKQVLNDIVEGRLKKEIIKRRSDDRISGDHAYDDEWSGSVPYSIYVFERSER